MMERRLSIRTATIASLSFLDGRPTLCKPEIGAAPGRECSYFVTNEEEGSLVTGIV